MVDSARKKSPRAPSLSLDEALTKALLVYEKESRHEVPAESVARGMGYNGTKNGSALAALASLRYYGFVERPREGMLCITKEVETYKYAPDEEIRRQLLRKWVGTPPVFAELLQKYTGSLPSDVTIRFDLIQMGFTPIGAADCLAVFRKSVDYARYYDEDGDNEGKEEAFSPTSEPEITPPSVVEVTPRVSQEPAAVEHGVDRIPIRLTGNRRAWIEIPSPFYEKDKQRIKAQVDLLLADEEGYEGLI